MAACVSSLRHHKEQHRGLEDAGPTLAEVLKRWPLWVCGVNFLSLYVIRLGIEGWIRVYMEQGRGTGGRAGMQPGAEAGQWASGLGSMTAPFATASFLFWWQVGGFTGTFVAGPLSDHLTGGRRILLALLCSAVLLTQLPLLASVNSPRAVAFLGALSGFAVFAQRTLFTLFARQQVPNRAGGKAAAITNLMAEAGGALAGYPLIKLVEQSQSWGTYISTLQACGVVLCCVNLFLLTGVEGLPGRKPRWRWLLPQRPWALHRKVD